MIALLKIHCPHCGVAGQVLMPPPGAIIIGPCPECNKLVAVFAGEALPLNDEIMNNGEIRAKYEHVLQVLSAYVKKQVRQCFTKKDNRVKDKREPAEPHDAEFKPITEVEIRQFVQTELRELDSREFFDHFG